MVGTAVVNVVVLSLELLVVVTTTELVVADRDRDCVDDGEFELPLSDCAPAEARIPSRASTGARYMETEY